MGFITLAPFFPDFHLPNLDFRDPHPPWAAPSNQRRSEQRLATLAPMGGFHPQNMGDLAVVVTPKAMQKPWYLITSFNEFNMTSAFFWGGCDDWVFDVFE